MMKLEDYSRNELKKIAKTKGMVDYHNLSKPSLIKQLNAINNEQELARENKVTTKGAKDLVLSGLNLSAKALQWKNYLLRINIKAEDFVKRFPNHIEIQYIQELIVEPTVDLEIEEKADETTD